jgi:hypothetical protein
MVTAKCSNISFLNPTNGTHEESAMESRRTNERRVMAGLFTYLPLL